MTSQVKNSSFDNYVIDNQTFFAQRGVHYRWQQYPNFNQAFLIISAIWIPGANLDHKFTALDAILLKKAVLNFKL